MLEFDRSGHEYVIVARAPFDRKIAARQGHDRLPVDAIEAMRRDRGRASGRAASARQPGASFPDAEPDVTTIDHPGERDIGALGEYRMVLEQRADARKIIGINVRDPEDGVRIAH